MSDSRDALLAPVHEGNLVVRMYRPGGLGDCFLLALPSPEGGEPRFVLVDCGVFNGTSGGSDRMRAIARDVAEVTGNHLHVLVATHEHWDHLSGFRWAQDTFDRLEVDEVWVAWTEDRTDPLAEELRRKRRRTARALAAAVGRLEKEGSDQAAAVGEVLGFTLGLDDAGAPDLGAHSPGTAKQMDYVCSQWGTPRFLRPGTDLRWPGLRFYVLGPPVDRELLERSDPSSSHSEVYGHALAMNERSAFAVAALAATGPEELEDDERDLLERAQPFEGNHRIDLETAGEDPAHGAFFRRNYGFSSRKGQGPAWRRIGADWLAAAGQLALQLDSDTNNTSLALAIEHEATGKVLLFPADAQVGNWLSWHRHRWSASGPNGEPGGEITCDDLLARTVLYKVGHHGSHNATLRELGLERMTSPELAAMIPVDAEQAEKKGWAMPFGPLHDRLRERCHGRVLRSDTGVPEPPGNVPAADWERFRARTAEDELWVQLAIPL